MNFILKPFLWLWKKFTEGAMVSEETLLSEDIKRLDEEPGWDDTWPDEEELQDELDELVEEREKLLNSPFSDTRAEQRIKELDEEIKARAQLIRLSR